MERARAELDREFVVFAAQRIVIDRLDVPVAAPVTVGSQPGPATMTSEDPGIVSVEPDGTLVAHRNGNTRLRAAGSPSTLDITVQPRRWIADSARTSADTRKGDAR